MGLLNKVIFDDIDSSDYDVFISGDGAYDAPARRGEMVTIPGRNGTVFMDEDAFENVDVTYPAFIGEKSKITFRETLRNYRSALSSKRSYCRIEDTYHPDEFRLGVFHNGVETDPHVYTTAGNFSITFDCKPQRFLKSGEIPVTFTSSGTIVNPTPFAASPLLKVTGNGVINIGDYQVSISGSTVPFWIDTEIMETYIPASEIYNFTDESDEDVVDEHGFILTFADGYVTPHNMWEYVTFKNHEFPKIQPGTQTVDVIGLDELIIVPRWWML